MASGIKITDEMKEIYNRINVNSKIKPALRYAIFKFSDKSDAVVCEKQVEPASAESYQEVVSSLPQNDVRYMAYDLQILSSTGMAKRKVILVSWHPEGAPVKRKMLVSSTFSVVKNAFNNRQDYIEGEELSEISLDVACEKLGGKPVPEEKN